jgi:peptide chain release factor 3
MSNNKNQLEDFKKRKYQYLATDKQGRDVFLADSAYSLQMAKDMFDEIEFYFKSEF